MQKNLAEYDVLAGIFSIAAIIFRITLTGHFIREKHSMACQRKIPNQANHQVGMHLGMRVM